MDTAKNSAPIPKTEGMRINHISDQNVFCLFFVLVNLATWPCFFPPLMLSLAFICHLLTSKKKCSDGFWFLCLHVFLNGAVLQFSFDIHISEPSWVKPLALTTCSYFREGKTDLLFHWILSGETVFWFQVVFLLFFKVLHDVFAEWHLNTDNNKILTRQPCSLWYCQDNKELWLIESILKWNKTKANQTFLKEGKKLKARY